MKKLVVHIDKQGGDWDYQIRTKDPYNGVPGYHGTPVATVNKYLRDVEDWQNHLVRAANNHEYLVNTLKRILDDLERGAEFCGPHILPDVNCARHRALYALKKVMNP